MSSVLTIFRREMAGLFLAPVAWILLFLVLFLNGWAFTSALVQSAGDVNLALRSYYDVTFFSVLLILLPPLLTMRMIAEEGRSGMLEFLLTAPVRDGAVVAGKALAATTFMAIAWSSILVYAAVLAGVGGAPDWGLVLTGWLGAVLLSGLLCAVGLFASALTSIPLLAAFLALLLNLLLLLVVPSLSILTQRADSAALRTVTDVLAPYPRFADSFQRGILDSGDVLFFLAWTGMFLFLSVRLLETRRWR